MLKLSGGPGGFEVGIKSPGSSGIRKIVTHNHDLVIRTKVHDQIGCKQDRWQD